MPYKEPPIAVRPGLPARVGVELEVEPLKYLQRDRSTILTKDQWRELLRERLGDDSVRVTHDPSLAPGGVELAFEDPSKQRVRTILKLLKEQQMGVTPRTGLHIHTDATDLTLKDVLNLYTDELGAKGFSPYAPQFQQSSYNRKLPAGLTEELKQLDGEDREQAIELIRKYTGGTPENYLSPSRGYVINPNPWFSGGTDYRAKAGKGSIEYRTAVAPKTRAGNYTERPLRPKDIEDALRIISEHRQRALN